MSGGSENSPSGQHFLRSEDIATGHADSADDRVERTAPLVRRHQDTVGLGGDISGAPVRTVYTFCRYCHAGCGVDVSVVNNRVVKISPDKQNPHTWQDFCAKGRTAHQLVEHPRRILNPMRRVGDGYVEASWEEAIADIAARMKTITRAGGPDAVGIYWGNPAGYSASNLTFMNAWLDAVGTQNRYFVGSVDQNALHVVATAMYGSQLMVPVSDVDNCDFFLLVGANPAVSAWNWVENVPGGWKRTLARKQSGATLVVVDPLRTETADKADVHLAVRPGQDWALLLAMVKIILEGGLEHRQDCCHLATGMPELRKLVARADLDDLAARCDVPRAQIESIATDFALARRAMVVTRTGTSLHLAGTIAEWLGHVLNVITGRMDRPGGRRFEKGYVDSLKLFDLAAKPVTHRSRVHQWDTVAGHHALSELPDEIMTPGHGQIRALVINCGNPVVSGPEGTRLDEALGQLDLLVAIDFVQRESHRHAHWLLPAVHWLERDDLLALTSGLQDQTYVHFGRKAVDPPPGTRQEWQIFVDLAIAMRRPLFGVRGINAFIRLSRAVARALGRPALAFDASWVSRLLVATGRRVNGRRLRWREILAHPHGWVLGPREFGYFRAALKTDNKMIQLAPAQFVARATQLLASDHPQAPDQYPFYLANRRNRHSMNSWLNELPGLHPSGKTNQVIIHPDDAEQLGVREGDRVQVFSAVGRIELTAAVSDRPRRGVVIVDHGWGSRIFDPRGGEPPHSYGVNRNLLVEAGPVDPLSQQPALSSAFVGVEPICRGFR